jgi:uncharacterized membrane protein
LVDDVSLALALHVLAIVHWIGGLAFVTLIVLPLARLRRTADEALAYFEAVEGRFAPQVRVSVALAGATGLWMTYRMDLWSRFADRHFWWLSAMAGLWCVFALMLFVVEPLLGEKIAERARRNPALALRRMAHLHALLLLLAAVTVFGAVAGAHGFDFF